MSVYTTVLIFCAFGIIMFRMMQNVNDRKISQKQQTRLADTGFPRNLPLLPTEGNRQ